MSILHSFGICVVYLLVSQDFVHATIEIIDSFGRKVEDFPNRYATLIDATIEGYIESANPSDACTEIDPPTFPKNFTMKKLVLINGTRTCDFMTKVQNAKAVGYNVAVLFDPSPEPFEYNITFPLLDLNLSAVLLLCEDAIVIRKNFLYHNISDKENFIISINSNVNPSLIWGQIIFFGILSGGIMGFCVLSVGWCCRKCRNLNEDDDDSDSDSDNEGPDTDLIRSVLDQMLNEYAALQQGTPEQRRNALRNLKKRHPSIEYSEDHRYNIDMCAICCEGLNNGGKVRKLGCDHEFHTNCIDDCLVLKSRRGACPLCNSEVNLANSLRDATESTRLLTSAYGLYSSSSRSGNGNESSGAAYCNESGELLAGAEGSVNFVENLSDEDDQQGLNV